MTFNYARAQATAERLIENFGHTATLIQQGAETPSADPRNPTIGDPTLFPIKVVRTMFKANEVDGTLIRADDVKFIVAATGARPRAADRIAFDGLAHQIHAVTELNPAGTRVLFTVHCRGFDDYDGAIAVETATGVTAAAGDIDNALASQEW